MTCFAHSTLSVAGLLRLACSLTRWVAMRMAKEKIAKVRVCLEPTSARTSTPEGGGQKDRCLNQVV